MSRAGRGAVAGALALAVLAACAGAGSSSVDAGPDVTEGRPRFGVYSSGGPGTGGSTLPAIPSDSGYYILAVDGGAGSWVNPTLDMIGAAFTVSLSLASGGGTFEVGQTATPTFNASPATNSANVTSCTISDNQGNGPTSVSSANPLAAPSGGGTYARTTPGVVTVTVTETQVSPPAGPKSGTATADTFDYRFFCGVDAASGATSATASVNNATLAAPGSATLTGALFGSGTSSMVGAACSITAANQYWYGLYVHTASAHTFVDANTGFAFSASVVGTFSFTNQFGVSYSADLYRSDFLLNSSFQPKVQS